VTGAAYRVDTLKEPAKGRDGKLKLSVAKDRPGNRAKGTTAAIIDLHSTAAGVQLVVHLEEHQGEAFRPTVLMERVSRHLERLVDGASQRSICRDVTGKTDGIRVALGCLVEDGFATFDTATKTYRSVREYRENDVQNVKRAPAPQARPTAPQGAFQTSAPPTLRGTPRPCPMTSPPTTKDCSDDHPTPPHQLQPSHLRRRPHSCRTDRCRRGEHGAVDGWLPVEHAGRRTVDEPLRVRP
jgi:hypothetical protein